MAVPTTKTQELRMGRTGAISARQKMPEKTNTKLSESFASNKAFDRSRLDRLA